MAELDKHEVNQALLDAVAHLEAAASKLDLVEGQTLDEVSETMGSCARQAEELVEALRVYLYEERAVLCTTCDGQGVVHREVCDTCDGEGVEEVGEGVPGEVLVQDCTECHEGRVLVPVTCLEVPHKARVAGGVERCDDPACEECPDCGRDGCGPGVRWGVPDAL